MPAVTSPLAPFSVRSFRFQWPADLATSWAIEMEALILGWYVLSATGSVQSLVIIAALAWVGTLFSPLLGILGDRVGVRNLLCATRALYALLAGVLTALILTDALVPWHAFLICAIGGLLRPSDIAMRNVLVAHTMPPAVLIGALAISRTTLDTARIMGALAGTGGVALVGMGAAYAVVTAMYVAAFLLSLGVAAPALRRTHADTLASLVAAVRYVGDKPDLLGAFGIAFLVNLLAYPFFLGLLPFVAKDVYQIGQAGLGYLAMAFAGVGVAVQAWALGGLPAISLALAVSFGGYGVVRKHVAADAQTGFLVECVAVALPALAYVLWLAWAGQGHFGVDPVASGWLIATGPITAIPLVLFAWAARRIPLSAMGFLQFIGPTISFLIGLVEGEAFTPLRAASFGFIVS